MTQTHLTLKQQQQQQRQQQPNLTNQRREHQQFDRHLQHCLKHHRMQQDVKSLQIQGIFVFLKKHSFIIEIIEN